MEHLVDSRHLEDAVRKVDLRDAPPHPASTLVKQPGLRVVLLRLSEGAQIAEHHVDHEFTLLVLRGRLRVQVAGANHELAERQLLAVARDLPHAVTALEDSEALLTVSWAQSPGVG